MASYFRQITFDPIVPDLNAPQTRTLSGHRLSQLATSNEPPSENELQILRDVISRNKTRLSEVDERIAQNRATIDSLDSLFVVWGQLQTRIKDLEFVMAPIRRAPADILSVIFDFHADQVDDRSLPDSLDVRKGPWRLGQVCRLWRSLVGELPRLWSRVDLLFVNSRYRPPRHSRYLLDRLLHNTKKSSLSVGLHQFADGLGYILPLLRAITHHSERWKDLRITSRNPERQQSLQYLSTIKGRLSTLETLHIHGAFIPCDTFSSAPQLHQLAVICSDPSRLFKLIPWAQITRYAWSASATSASDGVFAVIRRMPNLEQCDIDCEATGDLRFIPRPMLQLSSLCMLNLKDCRHESVGEVLSWLRAPALRQLTLRGDFDHASVVSLGGFLACSASSLANLRLDCVKHVAHHELIELLSCVPSLKELDLGEGVDTLTSGLFVALVNRSDSDSIQRPPLPLLPNLRNLGLHRLRASQFDSDACLGMIESRWNVYKDSHPVQSAGQLTCLRKLTLSWIREVSTLFLEDPRLDKFRSEGLHVESNVLPC